VAKSDVLQRDILHDLLASFDKFCRVNNIEYWIAHGTLLGYFWGQRRLAWDDDVDVQTTLSGLYKLNTHNEERNGKYLLDVNYNFRYRNYQKTNKIDARFIDTASGLFIDITGLAPLGNSKTTIACKSPHSYLIRDIFPLREANFEGIATFVPNNWEKVLKEEYGPRALSDVSYQGYRFSNVTQAWELYDKVLRDELIKAHTKSRMGKFGYLWELVRKKSLRAVKKNNN
jgi:phosphorylcholine metabolism protein LicD